MYIILYQEADRMPFIWGYSSSYKHIIPPILIVAFVLGAVAKTDEGQSIFGHNDGYVAWPYQVWRPNVMLSRLQRYWLSLLHQTCTTGYLSIKLKVASQKMILRRKLLIKLKRLTKLTTWICQLIMSRMRKLE